MSDARSPEADVVAAERSPRDTDANGAPGVGADVAPGGTDQPSGSASEAREIIDLRYEEALAAVDQLRARLAGQRPRQPAATDDDQDAAVPVAAVEVPAEPEAIDDQDAVVPVAAVEAPAEPEAQPPARSARASRVAAPRPEVVPSPRPEEAPLGLATPAPSIRRTPRLLWVAVPVVLVAIVWALSGPIGERPEASRGEPPPAASAESEDQPQPAGQPAGKPRAGTKPFFNATAGYGFRYPRSWSVSSNGEVAKVISPDRTEVVSFALGPVGLPATYESFAALLRDSYRSVAFSRHRSAAVEGNPAVRVSGRAVNTSGTRLRFRALLVERPGERSVGVFAATRAGGPPSRGALSVLDSLHFAASA